MTIDALARQHRIPGLDGLRAVAILLVIICHTNVAVGIHPVTSRADHLISVLSSGGWVGVDLFFVLSGFLITGILCRDKDSAHYYRNFYIRRTLRIFPLFYAYTLVVIFAFPLVFRGANSGLLAFWGQGSWLDRASVLAYFYNFRAAWIGHHLPLVNHFWSLAAEEHFYFVWPFVVLRFSRGVLMRICIVGCCLSLLLRLALMNSPTGLFAAYVLTPCRLEGLLLGAWLALASLDATVWKKVGHFAPYLAAITATIVMAIAVNRRHFYDFVPPGMPHDSRPIVTAGIFLISLLFAALLAIVLRGGWLTRWLELSSLRRIGLYSYGMYVYHECIILLIQWTPLLNGLSSARSKLVLTLLTTVISFIVAAASYHGFEQPFLRLKRQFESRRTERFVAAHA